MDRQKIRRIRIALGIFKDLADAKIKASDGQLTYSEAYDDFLEEIKRARSPKTRMITRDRHGRMIRGLIDYIEEIVGVLFSKNFTVDERTQTKIAGLMRGLDEAILIYPFGTEIKFIPQTKLLSETVLPVFKRAIEIAETDKNEAWLSLLDVESRIYKFREAAEREWLGNLEFVYPLVSRLKEKSELRLACC